ncbi:MAG: sulfatase-like hydrolase/transferase, partial [Lentisphaeria bacterium]|nr:sulfatase-like hydrolase/transferase [Lentisphaeria bacterium]
AAPAPASSPFFLWCSFPDPHEPFAAVKKWSDFYDDVDIQLPPQTLALSPESRSRTMTKVGLGTDVIDPELIKKSIKQTYGMESHVDEQVGRVLDCLDELGITDNTVVIFISDHGDQLGEHGLFYKSVYPYDAHMRIPFIVKAPGAPKGKVVEDVVSMLDLVPTVMDLAGVAFPCDLPGEGLAPVVAGDAEPLRKTALVEIDRMGKSFDHHLPMRAIVTNEYKLVYYPKHKETMLFDRKNDPCELKNLAGEPELQPLILELFKQLQSELTRTEMPALLRK